MNSENKSYESVISDDSLKLFVRKMSEFDKAFCDAMTKESDFTLRLELRGNIGELLHVRLYQDDMERPKGVQKRIDDKKSGKMSNFAKCAID